MKPTHKASLSPSAIALIVLALLGVLGFLVWAKSVLIPLVTALVLQALFSPIVRGLRRRGVPRGLTAAGLVLVMCAGVGTAAYHISEPAAKWAGRLPYDTAQIRLRIDNLRAAFRDSPVARASEQVEEIAKGEDEKAGKPREVVVVVDNDKTMLSRVISYTSSLGIAALLSSDRSESAETSHLDGTWPWSPAPPTKLRFAPQVWTEPRRSRYQATVVARPSRNPTRGS